MKKTDGFIKEIKCGGRSLELYKELEAEETEYKMYAEVKELPGCYIAGDTEKEVLAEAPAVIDVYLDSRKAIDKKKPRLISVKVKQELYDYLVRYADEKGIENVSTALRSLAVRKLREEGYGVQYAHAISR